MGFENAIAALKQANSDEEVMVGLTLLPSFLDEKDTDKMQLAFNTIPWNFIHRLLVTPDPHFIKIGVYIWTSFCVVPFVFQKKFLKRLDTIVALFGSEVELEVKELVMDHIIKASVLRKDCLNPELLTILLSVDTASLQQKVLDFVDQAIHFDSKKQVTMLGQVCLDHLYKWLEPDCAVALDTPQMLAKILSILPDIHISSDILTMYKLCMKRLVVDKSIKTTKQQIIILCSFFSKSGPFLKLRTSPSIKVTGKTIAIPDSKFVVILSHLACAEIRVILDSTTASLSSQENELLPMYYSLVEDIISSLIEETVKLEHSELASLRTALAETYLAVAAFLAERWDLYLETNNFKVLDNITTIFSLGSYSKWVAEESSVPVEELERLTPLLVTVCQTPFESIQFDPVELLSEMIPLVTSEPEALDCFLQQSGDLMLIDKLKRVQKPNVVLTLLQSLLNIVITSDTRTLETKFEVYSTIMPKLVQLMETKEEFVKAHAIALFLNLYRSSLKYRRGRKIPLDSIFEFIEQPSDNTTELWYLIVLALYECIPNTLSVEDSKSKIQKLENVKDQLEDQDDIDAVIRLTTKLKIAL